jgi:ParB-like chromosome segregation protein Spo0J
MDESLQVRRKLNATAIAKYASIYKSGGSMTPVRVARIKGGGPLMLVDGWHRIAALKSLGRGRVEAEVFETTTKGARWEAAKANLNHGVPLKGVEYRNVFKAYIHARQHRDAKGRLKSYRDIAAAIGGTRSYSTIRNWMIADFPTIAREMGGAEPAGEGGLVAAPTRHPEDEVLEAGLRGADNAAAAARSLRDPVRRGQLIDELTKALKLAQEGGPYELPSDEF